MVAVMIQLRSEVRRNVVTNVCALIGACSLTTITWGAGMWWGSLALLACCAAFVIGVVTGEANARERRLHEKTR